MAVERPAPGLCRGGFAKQNEVVTEFIHDFCALNQFAEEAVDTHGGDCFLVAFGREGSFEDCEDGVSDFVCLFVEAEALVCEEELGVGPCSPFWAVDVVAEDLLLLVCHLGEERFGGRNNVVNVDFFVFVVEEAFSDNA